MSKSMAISVILGILIMCTACSPEAAPEPAPPEDNQQDTIGMVEEIVPPTDDLDPTTTIEPSNTPEPTSTAEPTPTTKPIRILFEDDFSDVTTGWERYRQIDGILDYHETMEVYQLQLTQQGDFFWVYLYTDYTNLVMRVDVTQVAGPEGAAFGIMCRFDRPQVNGVVFLITSSGQAGVGTIEEFRFAPLPGGEFTDFNGINTDLEAMNTLEAACAGDQLRFSANGQVLFNLPAPDILGNAIGFVADSELGAGVDIHFYNLVVYEP